MSNSTFNLQELIDSVEQAGSMTKLASAKTEPAPVKPAVADQFKEILEKKAGEDLTKQASEAGARLAQEFLTKLSMNEIQVGDAMMQMDDDKKITPTMNTGLIEDVLKDTVEKGLDRGATTDDRVDEMQDKGMGSAPGDQINDAETVIKQAQIKEENMSNEKLAKEIMTKVAQMVGETPTTPAAGASSVAAMAPNKIQEDNDAMTAYDDAKVMALPGASGSLTDILQGLVDRAKAQGAGSQNMVDGEAPMNGEANDVQPVGSETEKAAAVMYLTNAGCDFDTAVNMVKQAEYEIAAEEYEVEKKACFDALIQGGMNFDNALELIKAAESEMDKEDEDASREDTEDDEQEKKAAFDQLVAEGYSFDQAVELVKQAEAKIKAEAGK